jgi:exopolysaccharide biosynthesis WecB/TagA/CpsF family protein
MRQDTMPAIVAPLHAPVVRPLRPLALVDGQAVNTPTLAKAVTAAMTRVQAGRPFTLFTLNLDHLVKRRTDAAFRAAYARADIVTADGQPVVTLMRRQGAALERTTGADLVMPLCAAAEAAGVPVCFYGATPESLEAAAARLKRWYPRLDVRGCESPPMGFDPLGEDAAAAGRRIAASGARICFVALGAPKQELFADRLAALHRKEGQAVGYVCIGAALDFISGRQRRAPALFRRTGLEWAFRLCSNPMRLGARYAAARGDVLGRGHDSEHRARLRLRPRRKRRRHP